MDELLQSLLEALLDENKEDSIYMLRSLAEYLEEGGDLEAEEVASTIHVVADYCSD